MDEKQFSEISSQLNKILGMLSVQGIDDRDKKIYALKKVGMKSEDIEALLGISNVRNSKGWKRK